MDNPSPQPQNVPTQVSAELALSAVNSLRAELGIRFNAISAIIEANEKAVALQHDDLVRVPTDVQKTTSALREFLEQVIQTSSAKLGKELENLAGRIESLIAVSDERFKGIQIQFTFLKQANEQLDLANKTAISAALQAQKESAGETQKSSQAAIAKSETSTSEAIKALTSTFNAAMNGLTDRYNDLKSRLDRGEGKTSVTDPAIGAALSELSTSMKSLNAPPASKGTEVWLTVIAVAGVVGMLMLLAIAFAVFSNRDDRVRSQTKAATFVLYKERKIS